MTRAGAAGRSDPREVLERMLIGISDAIRELRSLILKVAPTEIAVLVEGETGTGKEVVATAVHVVSERPGRCVAYSASERAETLFEASLFGYTRGSFTGALADVDGALKEADGGTFVLDEAQTIPMPLQPKFLRVFETRTYRRLGASGDETSDFRLVTLANESLTRAVAEGRFRGDLRARLNGMPIFLHPLRERPEDIPLLVEHFAATLSFPDGIRPRFGPGAMRALTEYSWPGNVRELAHIVHRLGILARGAWISARDVERALAAENWSVLGSEATDAERRVIEGVLRRHDWDVTLAARDLGRDRSTLYRKMSELGIRRPPGARSRGIRGVSRPESDTRM